MVRKWIYNAFIIRTRLLVYITNVMKSFCWRKIVHHVLSGLFTRQVARHRHARVFFLCQEFGCMEGALAFIGAFPEARAWHLTILTSDKRCLVNKASITTQDLLRGLDSWLTLQKVHVFIRPLLLPLVFLDLDDFTGPWPELTQLRPRVISQTSDKNFQFWGTIAENGSNRTTAWATTQLQQFFKSDARSTAPSQQGRLPGSVNCKPGKAFTVRIVSHQIADMCEQTMLNCIPKVVLQVQDEQIQRKPKRSCNRGQDASAEDWKTCCQYWENNPAASLHEALIVLSGPMLLPHNRSHSCFAIPSWWMIFAHEKFIISISIVIFLPSTTLIFSLNK